MSQNEQEFDLHINDDELVFTTSVVSRLLEIPVWVLKRLDEKGVVTPPRKPGQSRLYSKQHLYTIKKVWYLMEKRNVGIDGVKVILEIENGEFKTP